MGRNSGSGSKGFVLAIGIHFIFVAVGDAGGSHRHAKMSIPLFPMSVVDLGLSQIDLVLRNIFIHCYDIGRKVKRGHI